jgi:hypothetical protein
MLKDRIAKLNKELESVLGGAIGKPRTHQMSAAGRARIAAAQRARWAKIKSAKKD